MTQGATKEKNKAVILKKTGTHPKTVIAGLIVGASYMAVLMILAALVAGGVATLLGVNPLSSSLVPYFSVLVAVLVFGDLTFAFVKKSLSPALIVTSLVVLIPVSLAIIFVRRVKRLPSLVYSEIRDLLNDAREVTPL